LLLHLSTKINFLSFICNLNCIRPTQTQILLENIEIINIHEIHLGGEDYKRDEEKKI
jgi:hypothetical protein